MACDPGEESPFDFHAYLAGKLNHLQGRPIMAAADRSGAPVGWLIVTQHWGGLMLHDLADSTQGYIALTGVTHVRDVTSAAELEVWQPLTNYHSQPMAGLDYHVVDPLTEDPATEKIERSLFILNRVGAVLLVGVLMHFWILRSFALSRASLVDRNPALLAPSLLSLRSEFGQRANLVQFSVRDREQLRQRLDERIRLGQELHDGAIQSVYRTGTRLTSR